MNKLIVILCLLALCWAYELEIKGVAPGDRLIAAVDRDENETSGSRLYDLEALRRQEAALENSEDILCPAVRISKILGYKRNLIEDDLVLAEVGEELVLITVNQARSEVRVKARAALPDSAILFAHVYGSDRNEKPAFRVYYQSSKDNKYYSKVWSNEKYDETEQLIENFELPESSSVTIRTAITGLNRFVYGSPKKENAEKKIANSGRILILNNDNWKYTERSMDILETLKEERLDVSSAINLSYFNAFYYDVKYEIGYVKTEAILVAFLMAESDKLFDRWFVCPHQNSRLGGCRLLTDVTRVQGTELLATVVGWKDGGYAQLVYSQQSSDGQYTSTVRRFSWTIQGKKEEGVVTFELSEIRRIEDESNYFIERKTKHRPVMAGQNIVEYYTQDQRMVFMEWVDLAGLTPNRRVIYNRDNGYRQLTRSQNGGLVVVDKHDCLRAISFRGVYTTTVLKANVTHLEYPFWYRDWQSNTWKASSDKLKVTYDSGLDQLGWAVPELSLNLGEGQPLAIELPVQYVKGPLSQIVSPDVQVSTQAQLEYFHVSEGKKTRIESSVVVGTKRLLIDLVGWVAYTQCLRVGSIVQCRKSTVISVINKTIVKYVVQNARVGILSASLDSKTVSLSVYDLETCSFVETVLKTTPSDLKGELLITPEFISYLYLEEGELRNVALNYVAHGEQFEIKNESAKYSAMNRVKRLKVVNMVGGNYIYLFGEEKTQILSIYDPSKFGFSFTHLDQLPLTRGIKDGCPVVLSKYYWIDDDRLYAVNYQGFAYKDVVIIGMGLTGGEKLEELICQSSDTVFLRTNRRLYTLVSSESIDRDRYHLRTSYESAGFKALYMHDSEYYMVTGDGGNTVHLLNRYTVAVSSKQAISSFELEARGTEQTSVALKAKVNRTKRNNSAFKLSRRYAKEISSKAGTITVKYELDRDDTTEGHYWSLAATDSHISVTNRLSLAESIVDRPDEAMLDFRLHKGYTVIIARLRDSLNYALSVTKPGQPTAKVLVEDKANTVIRRTPYLVSICDSGEPGSFLIVLSRQYHMELYVNQVYSYDNGKLEYTKQSIDQRDYATSAVQAGAYHDRLLLSFVDKYNQLRFLSSDHSINQRLAGVKFSTVELFAQVTTGSHSFFLLKRFGSDKLQVHGIDLAEWTPLVQYELEMAGMGDFSRVLCKPDTAKPFSFRCLFGGNRLLLASFTATPSESALRLGEALEFELVNDYQPLKMALDDDFNYFIILGQSAEELVLQYYAVNGASTRQFMKGGLRMAELEDHIMLSDSIISSSGNTVGIFSPLGKATILQIGFPSFEGKL
jgi:hypothetical protein